MSTLDTTTVVGRLCSGRARWLRRGTPRGCVRIGERRIGERGWGRGDAGFALPEPRADCRS